MSFAAGFAEELAGQGYRRSALALKPLLEYLHGLGAPCLCRLGR